ncbi:acyl-CoA N-acyltransferase [Mycena galopus ATCC 62051]|nr:acyl-CoA N-acyltransferase [Mycena galopus ATCC 62051]
MTGLQYNATTGEPFLRLPAPFSNIILTPPRMSDVARSVEIMNDPFIFKWMGQGTLYSYTAEKAEAWLTQLKAETDAQVAELRGATEPHLVSGCPVRHIREEQADGTDVFLGDLSLIRSSFAWVLDTEERARLVAENNARPAGDPGILWHTGYYLAPSHNGRGLTTAALKTVIAEFGIPWLNVTRLRSAVFEGNIGSIRVLQKNGFEITETFVQHIKIGEEKEEKTGHLLDWRPDSLAS